jgi:hypothetical protein
MNVDERRLARQLSDLGNELTRSLLHDRGAVSQGIASRDAHRSLDQNVHAGRDIARHEQGIAGCVMAIFPKTAQPIDFLRRKLRKHLLPAAIDRRHFEPRD